MIRAAYAGFAWGWLYAVVCALACVVGLSVGGCTLRGIRPSFEIAGPEPPVTNPGGEFDAALFQTTGAHLRPGHRFTLEPDGVVFDALEADIAEAQVSINFVEYIWEPSEPSERLVRALAQRKPNVKCRILADPMGSPDFAEQVKPALEKIGCEARLFRPVSSHNFLERDHRKLVIIDGRVAYLGGFGVRKEWLAKRRHRRRAYGSGVTRGFGDEWRDDNIRITGPSVQDVQRAWAQNWQEAGGALLPAAELPDPEPDGDSRMAFVSSSAGYLTVAERLVHLLVGAAQKRVWIANAYFVPDESLQRLLIEKVKAGVDVRVLAPGQKNDLRLAAIGQKRTYGELLDGGVHIYEYQPVMMHAKTMIIDDRVAMIGSLNLNLISLVRLEEAALVVDDPELVHALDAEWQKDLENAREVKK
jgi:cardiolipin synthase